MEETKVIYYIDEEQTPYLVKIPLSSSQVTLRDFKTVLNKQSCNYKYFFKSVDADFGVVKEEIVDESTVLPVFNGRVISWLVTADGSNQSDNCSEIPHSEIESRIGGSGGGGSGGGGGIGNRNEQGNGIGNLQTLRKPFSLGGQIGAANQNAYQHHMNIPANPLTYQSASVMSSDLDATSLFETESEITLDRDMTECSSVHRLQVRKKPQRRKKRAPSMSRTSSYSSITDSTMSLNIITVSINMEAVNFLGISIVGQSNRGGDGGIYVGSIMKGGAVALNGRIEPGDMILQVNDINFENMTNDEAVRVLREVVQKPGPIKLVVAKCWDPNPKGYFTIPRTEPVRPIDPGAWVAHTQAVTSQEVMGCHPDVGSIHGHLHGIGIPSLTGTMTNTSQNPSLMLQERLNRNNLEEIVKAMTKPDSGLEIRDRMWLKIVIPNAFIGADAVNWVLANVDGVSDRREARRIVSSMLRNNLIKHTVNKLNFSEQCYYVVGDGSRQIRMTPTIGDTDSIASDIAPLPNPPVYMPYSGTYNTSHGYQPIQYGHDRHISSGSSSSDVLTSKDISASQSDITSIIHQTNHMTITNGSNKSSGSSHREGLACSSNGGNHDQEISVLSFF